MINKIEIHNKAGLIEGCSNRMCITDSMEELERLYLCMTLHAVDLYRLNKRRIYEYQKDEI